MNAFILTEGGTNIGFGHVTRCSSLCQAFEEKKIEVGLIVNGDETIRDVLSDRDCLLLNWLEEGKKALDILQGADMAVIDSYMAGPGMYHKIAGTVKMPVYLDDNKRLDYPQGIIVNGSINAESLDYSRLEGSEYLLGVKYVPLRKAFWEVPEKEIRENVSTIMVTFGGEDTRNMTPEILRQLVKEYPGLYKQIVIGKGCRNADQIEAAADNNTMLHYNPDSEAMLNIALASDIAISAGGQTLYELARIGVPAIAIAVADNQMNNITGWREAGCIEYAGWWEDGMILDNLRRAFTLLGPAYRRNEMSRTGRALVDGRGAKRIVEYIVNKESICRTI